MLEIDSSFQLFQAAHEGFCCASMPLDTGWASPLQSLAFIDLPDASALVPLGVVMRKTEPRSVIAENCFAEARMLFTLKN